MKFSVGDLIRCMDNSLRIDGFIEVRIDFVNHRTHQYEGLVVRDVCLGREVEQSNRVGFRTCVIWEGCMKRDWDARITLLGGNHGQ